MAEEKGGAERTEEPTPRRRQEDLEKGDPAVSQEAAIAMSLLVLALSIAWILPMVGPRVLGSFREAIIGMDMIDQMGRRLQLDRALVVDVLRATALRLASFVVPVGVASVITLGAVHLLQVGIRFQPERVKVDFAKLDPRKGIKRVVSPQFFVTLFKSLAKGLGIIALVGFILRDQPQKIWRLPFGNELGLVIFMQQTASSVLLPVTFVMIVIALIDFAWVRYRKEEGLKMSKQEVREDVKADAGDPHIRQARRQRMKDLVFGQPLPERMKDATVVATNPTHYAVALRYWPGRDDAPVVVAKGKDFRAETIRRLARALQVPIVEDKPLARGLFGLVKEGGTVPKELYQAVARLLAIVYRRREAIR